MHHGTGHMAGSSSVGYLTPHCYCHLMVVTKADVTHATGMLSCLINFARCAWIVTFKQKDFFLNHNLLVRHVLLWIDPNKKRSFMLQIIFVWGSGQTEYECGAIPYHYTIENVQNAYESDNDYRFNIRFLPVWTNLKRAHPSCLFIGSVSDTGC